MFLSVIVPVYKVEAYIDRCIESILSQDYTDFELILVDDGSPDKCREICDLYSSKDNRVRVFHQENAGVSCARNKGLDNVIGEYICFIDADDYILPGFFDYISRCCVNYDIIKFEGNQQLHGTILYRRFQKFIFSAHFSGVVWAYVIRRNLIEKYYVRFPVGVSHSEDHCFILKLMVVAERIAVCSPNFYKYQERKDSAIHQKLTHKAADSHLQALEDILFFYSKIKLYDNSLYENVICGVDFYFILLAKISLKRFSYFHAKKSFAKFKRNVYNLNSCISENFYIRYYKFLFFCILIAMIHKICSRWINRNLVR